MPNNPITVLKMQFQTVGFRKTLALLLIMFVTPLIALMLLNSPFWFLQQSFFLMRPVFNVDLILVAMVCIVSLRIGIPLLVFVWILDGVIAASYSYHFSTAFEFLSSVRFAGALGLRHFVTPTLLFVLLFFSITGISAIFVLRKAKYSFISLFLWTFLIFLLDVLNGSTQLFGFGQDKFFVNQNIAGSSIRNLIISKENARKNTLLPMGPSIQTSTFDAIASWHALHKDKSVLIVLVESMGIPSAPALKSWLDNQLFTTQTKSRWMTSSTAELFSGSTTSGELRVLCGLSGHYTSLTQSNTSGCLPVRMAADGYTTTGMHGFTSQMFDRSKWWPTIGLKSRFFAEQLIQSDRVCGEAFPGACDEYLIDKAVKQADQPKQFTYVLTLNTHLPLVSKSIPMDLLKLCRDTSTSESACQLNAQLGAVLSQVSISLANVAQPFLVAVVGDHAPPFNVIADRLSFSSNNVPLYLLTPKE